MKLSGFKKQGDRISFTIKDLDVELANALRRKIISGVPVMAIEKVDVLSNSSILNDEVLAHRLGLIPLATDLKSYVEPLECGCELKGCTNCTSTLTLDVAGPLMVYSGHLKPTDPKIKPVYDNMPLIKLTENQKIKLEAHATLGCGRQHMKWHAGIASYEASNNKLDFFIESYGQYPVEDLAKLAFNVFQKELSEVKKEVK
ncbi:MAG: DNA-directed RNA polymerase subunit D [Candidatus Altiarchaeales archaeon]|nr:DNA-directed RNA polymerase subunit D [Candidatus Altiarchaeales archaeon]